MMEREEGLRKREAFTRGWKKGGEGLRSMKDFNIVYVFQMACRKPTGTGQNN